MKSVRLIAARWRRRQKQCLIKGVAKVNRSDNTAFQMSGRHNVGVNATICIAQMAAESQRNADDAVVMGERGRAIKVDYRGMVGVLGGKGSGICAGRVGVNHNSRLLLETSDH